MKPRVESGNVVSSVNPEFTFGFDMTESGANKAFQVLCSSLYSDKIGAVVRETVCNAVDSHVFSNVERPVEVGCPTRLNPSFRVRDYGKGLDRDEIKRVYCTLFSSSKEASDDFTGYLGLGSKSPFAYTDNLVVESTVDRQDGKRIKTIYSLVRDGNSIPTVGIVSSTETSEETGLNIIVPVGSCDVQNFAFACNNYIPYFDNRVVLQGCALPSTDVYLDRTNLVDVGNGKQRIGYRIVKRNASSREVIFVMGNVPYQVDKKYVSHINDVYGRFTIEIFVKIGDVSVAPSRESLSYDKITDAYVPAKIRSTLAAIKKDLIGNIEKQTNWTSAVEAAAKAEEITSPIDIISHSWYTSSFTNGVIFKLHETATRRYTIRDNVVTVRSTDGSGIRLTDLKYMVTKKTWRTTDSFTIKPNLVLYIDDLKKGGLSRIREFGKKSSNALLVIPDWMKSDLMACGLPESVFVNASSLAPVASVPRQAKRALVGTFQWCGGSMRILADSVGTHAIHKVGGRYRGPNGQPIEADVIHELAYAFTGLKIYFTTDESVPANLWTTLAEMADTEYYCAEIAPRIDEYVLDQIKLPIVDKVKEGIATIRNSLATYQKEALQRAGIAIKEKKTNLKKLVSRIESEYPLVAELVGLSPSREQLIGLAHQLYGEKNED